MILLTTSDPRRWPWAPEEFIAPVEPSVSAWAHHKWRSQICCVWTSDPQTLWDEMCVLLTTVCTEAEFNPRPSLQPQPAWSHSSLAQCWVTQQSSCPRTPASEWEMPSSPPLCTITSTLKPNYRAHSSSFFINIFMKCFYWNTVHLQYVNFCSIAKVIQLFMCILWYVVFHYGLS